MPEVLFTKLIGGTCFAKRDCVDAFLQKEVDEDFKEVLTINTHKDLFRHNRVPFGTKLAPIIFQQTKDAVIMAEAAAFIDRITVADATRDELLRRIFSVFRADSTIWFLCEIRKMSIFPDVDQVTRVHFWREW